jgi:hypothetical protein
MYRSSLSGIIPLLVLFTWRVLSVDTHTTDGNFTFQVGP